MNKKKKIIIVSILIGLLLLTTLGIEIFFLIQDKNVESINVTESEKPENLYKTNEDGTIYFEDEALERYVKNNIYKDKVYPEDALKITSLTFTFTPIKSLVGLEHFKNLESLYIDECGINDISFLTNLKSLKYVKLINNGIYDISPLQELKDLRYVDISTNNVKDISPLKRLKHLIALPRIKGNSIMNYDVLEKNIEKYHQNMIAEFDNTNPDEISVMIDKKNVSICQRGDKECLIDLINKQDKERMDTYKYAMNHAKQFVQENINENMTDIEKEAIIVKHIIDFVDYNYAILEDYYNPDDYYLVFQTGKGVCENYSNMFNIIATTAGLESYSARSIKKDPFTIGHEWNIVKINGKYYHLDITWYDESRNTNLINVSTKTINSMHGEDTLYSQETLSKQIISTEDYDSTIISQYF